ncbi:MAG: hypothetical protein KatS3mg057_0105 [Herpetosiphonaceae bacterium]|nr:MAG: hypothetical protein KatS3mg057_0105 [Herpetosiphonaceae bacterium]
MTGFALALVLLSACIHATWNLLAKRAGSGGSVAFVWLVTGLAAVIYAPIAGIFLVLKQPQLGAAELLFMAGNALLHSGYFLVLQRGYKTGDLSLVYPLARGTGPVLSTVAAIALLGERPTPLALAGAVLIGIGVFVIAGGPGRLRRHESQAAVLYALLTGAFIAAYTIWDKYAVSRLLIHPLIFDWASNIGRVLLVTPLAFGRWDQVKQVWHSYRVAVIGVSVLSPLSYILMLTALSFSPVSYVAPTREISILIGTAMGSKLLLEGHARRRLIAAGVMCAGLVFLALG